jgi:hypothetical protein
MTIIAPLPFTLANGTTADADQVMADLNQIRNDVNVQVPAAILAAPSLAYRGCAVYNTTNQTFAIATALSFDSEIIDTDSIHASPSSRMTVPTGVTRVRLFGKVGWSDVGGTTSLVMSVTKNGGQSVTPIAQSVAFAGISAGSDIQISTVVIVCTAGDYFELQISPARSFTAVATETWFEMQILG